MSAQRLHVQFGGLLPHNKCSPTSPPPQFPYGVARIGVPPQKILHVAQSLYHDIARPDARLSTVWINRRHCKPGFGATPPAQVQPDLEVPDMRTLAEQIGVL